ncbi:hypothetical protein GB937_000543 [Aspergillus fischeri]|nr:hypothetical protein GB937_000543 [Aspergillus fischeri]
MYHVCFLVLLLASLLITSTAADRPTLYIIRHGEKSGDPEDSGLNADGFRRAQCLRDVFGVNSTYDIGYIVAPRPNRYGQHRRSFETVLPLAIDLGLAVDLSCKRNQVRCVAKLVRNFQGPGNILISWRHGKMKEIMEELGSDHVPEYPEDRFDLIWTVPFPYDNITDVRSEGCPGLDTCSLLKDKSTSEYCNEIARFYNWIVCGLVREVRMDDIEERLRSHAQAFDGLLSLIPAKYYYGEDGSDQWKRKKQTKEQAREAKRAKLDPDSAKTAKDVMDENARKRKRGEEEQNGSESSEEEELGSELPKEGLKRGDVKSKKQKQAATEQSDDAAAKLEEAEARKKLREEKKAQKKAAQKEKKKAKEASKKDKKSEKSESKPASDKGEEQKPSKVEDSDDEIEQEGAVPEEGLSLEFNPEPAEQSSSPSSTPNSPGFDASNDHSGSSSISSIAPPTASTDANDASQKSSSEPKPLKPTPEELKQRLQKRLDELRAARQADGFNGKPARNRQELIEARRQKAEQRKAHKKLLRQKAREEEQRAKDEAMAKRFSPGGSGSLLASPRSPADSIGSNVNFSFGRVVFADGQLADPSLMNVREQPKRHGPQDPATALKAAEAKKARLAEMDEQKRADIEQKDMWLNAKKRAHGEKVRDDTSLLKKALKRKESAKKKSEREWKERLEAVKKGKDARQQKREENLRKRREEKGNKGKIPAAGKKKARPGFEGSFKAKVGGKK